MQKNIILPILLALVSCGKKAGNTDLAETPAEAVNTITLTPGQLKSADIRLGSLEEKNISSVIKVNGKIDVPPQNMVSVSMPLGGYLKSTHLLPGMHIRKGEMIATLEDQQYIQLQEDYLTAKSKLVFAEAEYLRQKELNKDKASSDRVFQAAQMEYNSTRIALSALTERLKLIHVNPSTLSEGNLSKSVNLYSPIDGFVSKVNVNIGKYVTPADILFELVNPADIHLNLMVFEKDLHKLFIGQKLFAYTNHEPERRHICDIILISKDLSPERSAEIHCHFEDYDKTLLPGMYMNAEIEVKNNRVFALPEESVVNFEGKDFLFVSNGKNEFQMVEVTVGENEKGFTEILNHASFVGKPLVTHGAYSLLMALKNKEED